MTVTEKLAHAAERKAFETMLDSLIRKSRTQDVGKVADDLVSMVQRIHSSVWEPETFAMLHKIANDPNSKWAHYAERLLRECDPYLLRTFLTAAAYEGGFRGFQQARANSEKYDCNIPWIVLMDPTSACNMRCAGCWAAEYGHKQNLTFEEMDRVLTEGAELGTHACLFTGGEPLADLNALQQMLDAIPATHKIYINTTFPAQTHTSFEEMLAFTERNKDKITCMNISRHLQHYVEESPDQVLGKIACPTRINCVLYKNYPAAKLVDYVERFLPYRIPIQFRYDYTETTPENLYEEEHDKILQDLKRLFTYKGLDGCRMRNGFHFEYKGLHMTYHKTLPYSTIEEKGPDGVTYDILYDILIKQNGEIHSDWTGVKMDVDAYRRVVFEPYDLKVLNGTIDF